MSYITDLVSQYGLLAMFLIILLEYACFPISSEFVLPFCGAVASMNHTHFLIILPISILAGLLGTGICYTVGWFGGGAIINAIKHRFPKSSKAIDASNARFKDNGASAVCIGRVIPLVRTYIALVAGSARMNPVTYFTASTLGITVWNTMLIGLGYSLRENYGKVAGYYDRYKQNLIPVFVIIITFILSMIIYKRLKRASRNFESQNIDEIKS